MQNQRDEQEHDEQKQRDEMVYRLREELRRKVRESGLTQRSLEETNGFTRGYLSQVLQGHVTLTARHVFGILVALEISPGAFFHRLFDDPGQDSWENMGEIRDIRNRLDRYDAALKQLERKGLIAPESDSSPESDP